MNILDYKSDDFNKDTWLEEMYNKQLGVAKKYKDIERMPDWPFSIDSRVGQVWGKDFLYRILEEIQESQQSILEPETSVLIDGKDIHRSEELADALHFYLELLIIWGIKPIFLENAYKEYKYEEKSLLEAYNYGAYRIGMVGDCLKNKPWKQDMIRTDMNKLRERLKLLFFAILDLFRVNGNTDEDIWDLYTKKNKVNLFRQGSNY